MSTSGASLALFTDGTAACPAPPKPSSASSAITAKPLSLAPKQPPPASFFVWPAKLLPLVAQVRSSPGGETPQTAGRLEANLRRDVLLGTATCPFFHRRHSLALQITSPYHHPPTHHLGHLLTHHTLPHT